MTLLVTNITHAQNIEWYVDDVLYSTSSCESGDDVVVPTAPNKSGYTFVGWDSVYDRILYLESSGTQYIDTGYIPNQDTAIKAKLQFSSVANNQANFGGAGYSYNQQDFELGLWDRKFSISYYNYNNNSIPVTISTEDIIDIDWNKNIFQYSINNNPASPITFLYGTFSASPYSMTLFASKRPNGVNKGKVKIYYCQIYDNGSLVHDFIPVIDYNNIPCMLDKVTNQFFYNAGTGDFIAGPKINE